MVDGIRLGYVLGYRCVCGHFNHTLLEGFIICCRCGERKKCVIEECGENEDEINV